MSNNPQDRAAGTKWWSRLRVAATGDATLKTVPAVTATGVTNRLIVEWYKITGLNTNAGAVAVEIRCATTTAAVLLGYTMAATTGSIVDSNSGLWIPVVTGESLQLSVGATLTGHVDVTIGGRIVSHQSYPLADKYTGAP